MDKTKNKNLPKWKNSLAKELLRSDILEGTVTDTMKAELVYDMREEYKQFLFKNFKTNLKNLQGVVQKKRKAADEDKLALLDYLKAKPIIIAADPPRPYSYPSWHTSDAKPLLVADIDAGIHETMTKDAFRQTRSEYMVYPQKVFRDHVYDEIRKRKARSYWESRTNKKKNNW